MSSMILLIFKFHSPSLSHLKSHFCSGGLNISRTHGSLQISRTEHQLDGGDAAHWWSIPSDDRISLHLKPHRQSSSEPGDVGAHRLCPTHQSAQDQCAARYHLSFSVRLMKCPSIFHSHILTFELIFTFHSPHCKRQFHRLGQLTHFDIFQFYIRRQVVWDSVAIHNHNFLSLMRQLTIETMGRR